MNLQSIVSREISPKQQVVVTVGQLHSGTRFNIVSGEAYLDGTVRCYDRDIHHAMPEIFARIVQNTAATYRCQAQLSYDKMVEVLVNDEQGSRYVYEAAKKVVDEPSPPPWTRTCPAPTIFRSTRWPGAARLRRWAQGGRTRITLSFLRLTSR